MFSTKLIQIPTIKTNGFLSVYDTIPFEIKRVFWIYDVEDLESPRGGHSHLKTCQALIAVNGSVQVVIKTKSNSKRYLLDSPSKCLLLNPNDWHEMIFSKSSVLVVLASTNYNKDDYVYKII